MFIPTTSTAVAVSATPIIGTTQAVSAVSFGAALPIISAVPILAEEHHYPATTLVTVTKTTASTSTSSAPNDKLPVRTAPKQCHYEKRTGTLTCRQPDGSDRIVILGQGEGYRCDWGDSSQQYICMLATSGGQVAESVGEYEFLARYCKEEWRAGERDITVVDGVCVVGWKADVGYGYGAKPDEDASA